MSSFIVPELYSAYMPSCGCDLSFGGTIWLVWLRTKISTFIGSYTHVQ